MGIIDSLSAGYRFLGKRLELLLIPVLLDLILWFTPRLSIAPLVEQVAAFYTQAAQMEEMPPDMVQLSEQVSQLLRALGQGINLLDMLVSSSLLHVPSLLVSLGPLLNSNIWNIQSVWTAFALYGLFGLLGLLAGVVYMNLLAGRLPIGGGPKPLTWAQFLTGVLRHWIMVVLFVLMVVVLLMVGSIPVMLGAAVLTLISPTLGSYLMLLTSGGIMVLFFYLYFVTAAIVMDNLTPYAAVMRSFALVRRNFWSTLGFAFLTYLIGLGITLAIRGLAQFAPIGTMAAILINAYIGSGLTMALLVFYRTRLLRDENKNIA